MKLHSHAEEVADRLQEAENSGQRVLVLLPTGAVVWNMHLWGCCCFSSLFLGGDLWGAQLVALQTTPEARLELSSWTRLSKPTFGPLRRPFSGQGTHMTFFSGSSLAFPSFAL